MRLRIKQLELVCKKATITVPFTDFNYFYGEMGAGKSTIVRLIDFCFGGEVEMTPALQSEFISVALELLVNDIPLRLERTANANQVFAVWTTKGEAQQLVVPARRANGVVLPDTEVEVISDLLFYLAGFKPPRVRRSRIKEDSDLQRPKVGRYLDSSWATISSGLPSWKESSKEYAAEGPLWRNQLRLWAER